MGRQNGRVFYSGKMFKEMCPGRGNLCCVLFSGFALSKYSLYFCTAVALKIPARTILLHTFIVMSATSEHDNLPSPSPASQLCRLFTRPDSKAAREYIRWLSADPTCPPGSFFSKQTNEECAIVLKACVEHICMTIDVDMVDDFETTIHCLRAISNFADMDRADSRRTQLFVETIRLMHPVELLNCFYAFSMAFLESQVAFETSLAKIYFGQLVVRTAMFLTRTSKGGFIIAQRWHWISRLELGRNTRRAKKCIGKFLFRA